MVKEIVLIKRKPGLSPEEFIKQYEEMHVPLLLKHCPTIKRYVRNYVRTTLLTPPGVEELEFDCVTEVWYDNMEGFKALANFVMSEAGKVIHDAEESFMDTRKTVALLVEEKASLLIA